MEGGCARAIQWVASTLMNWRGTTCGTWPPRAAGSSLQALGCSFRTLSYERQNEHRDAVEKDQMVSPRAFWLLVRWR